MEILRVKESKLSQAAINTRVAIKMMCLRAEVYIHGPMALFMMDHLRVVNSTVLATSIPKLERSRKKSGKKVSV